MPKASKSIPENTELVIPFHWKKGAQGHVAHSVGGLNGQTRGIGDVRARRRYRLVFGGGAIPGNRSTGGIQSCCPARRVAGSQPADAFNAQLDAD